MSLPCPSLSAMGRFAVKYSREQKDALLRAILDERQTAREAIAKAAKGQLGDVEPFDMPLSTARDLAKHARHKRAGLKLSPLARLDPAEGVQKLAQRCLSLCEQDLERMERKSRTVTPDQEHLRSVARTLREIAAFAANKPIPPRVEGGAMRDGRKKSEETRLVADLLAANAKNRGLDYVPPETAPEHPKPIDLPVETEKVELPTNRPIDQPDRNSDDVERALLPIRARFATSEEP